MAVNVPQLEPLWKVARVATIRAVLAAIMQEVEAAVRLVAGGQAGQIVGQLLVQLDQVSFTKYFLSFDIIFF